MRLNAIRKFSHEVPQGSCWNQNDFKIFILALFDASADFMKAFMVFTIFSVYSKPYPFNYQCSHYKETNPLIISASQLTDFNMRGIVVVNRLINSVCVVLPLIVPSRNLPAQS